MTRLKTVLEGVCVNVQKSQYLPARPSEQHPGRRASSYCWARSAVLLAFIFSSRLARWLLVISISSILSCAVRSWRQRAQSLYVVRRKPSNPFHSCNGSSANSESHVWSPQTVAALLQTDSSLSNGVENCLNHNTRCVKAAKPDVM